MGAIQYFAKFIPNLSEKTDNMRQLLKKGVKWEWTEERNTDFNNLKKELTTQPCLAHYNGNKENIVTTNPCNTGLGIALWQRQNNGELKAIAYASRYLNDAEKKNSVGELELLTVVWGLERFRFHLYGKQVQLFSDHQALEPLLKKNKTNKQYRARLTRWLDRLNHFDISLKHTAGKEIKFTDFISRNPTETAEPEENYEEEFVINAIAQLATVNGRIGLIFDQSENSNTANMHDTRTRIGTRYSKTNTNHFNLTANQINNTIHDNRKSHIELTMDNNNNNRQIPDRFTLNVKLKYHWGADDKIMKIINRRDNSPETQELVERRIELTRPGHMRHWHKKLEREIILPRRPDDVYRKGIKRIDIRLRRKEENRVSHIGGGYFKNFGDEIPQATGTSSESNTETINTQKHIPHTESTVSSTPVEPVITEEPGSYPAILVEDYREGPIEEIAVQYVRINKVIETKAPRNRQQEDNIRAADLDFMLDLETLIKETAADPDLIEVQCCIEDNNTQAIPDANK